MPKKTMNKDAKDKISVIEFVDKIKATFVEIGGFIWPKDMF